MVCVASLKGNSGKAEDSASDGSGNSDCFGEKLASVVLEEERTSVVPCSSLFFSEGSVLEVRWT